MLLRPLVVLVLIAACTPSTAPTSTDPSITQPLRPTPTTSPPAPLPVTPEDALEAFSACMDAAGVPVGDLRLDALERLRSDELEVDVDDPAVREALSACAGLLVVGGALDLGDDPELAREIRARLASFAACVREEGVEGFPDPVAEFDGTGAPFPTLPIDAPRLEAAVDACLEG